MEVNPRAVPPVCRLMDYDAFRYELRRKERDARKKAVERRRHDQIKELRLSARISPNDLKTKADQAMKFLKEGHKVTMRIEFKAGSLPPPSIHTHSHRHRHRHTDTHTQHACSPLACSTHRGGGGATEVEKSCLFI